MDFDALISSSIKSDKYLSSEGSSNFYVENTCKEVNQKVKEEIEKAKAFLSIPSQSLNCSLYDHLTSILVKIIREKTENSVDEIEDISNIIKSERFPLPANIFIQKPEKNENFLRYTNTLQQLLESVLPSKEDINLDIKEPEEDENEQLEEENMQNIDEEEEENQESEGLEKILSDLSYHMPRFELGGVGLSLGEAFKISLAMKVLVNELKLSYLRFWGKIWAIDADYYVVETFYREDIKQNMFGWKSALQIQKEKEELDALAEENLEEIEEEKEEEKEEENEEENVEEEETEESEPKYVVIPEVPVLQPVVPKYIAIEEGGTGTNKYLYFVCTQLGLPWQCLPLIEPEQIIAARHTKKVFTGKLNAEIRGYPSFPGKEAHYLRAQIARISAGTIISPEGYFCISEENDLGGETVPSIDEELPQTVQPTLSENPNYQPLSVREMLKEGLNKWAHQRDTILSSGRCTLCEGDDAFEEYATEEEAEVPETSDKEMPLEQIQPQIEKPIPLLEPLSMDKKLGKMTSWTLNSSSNMLSDMSVILARSNFWPGAYAYYDGRTFENIYIGYGCKFSLYHYSPTLPIVQQPEYPFGPEIAEHDPFEIEALEITETEQETEDANKDDDKT